MILTDIPTDQIHPHPAAAFNGNPDHTVNGRYPFQLAAVSA